MYVADPTNALQSNSDMNNAIAGQMEILSAKLYRDISEKLVLQQQQQQHMGAYYAQQSAYHPLPTAPLYTAPPMPPSTLGWQLPVPAQQTPAMQPVQSAKQYDAKPVSEAAITKAETLHTNLIDSVRVGVPAVFVPALTVQRSADVPGPENVVQPQSQFKTDALIESSALRPATDDFNSEKLNLLAESTVIKEEQDDRQRRIDEENELEAAKRLQEQRDTEMKLAKELEAKQEEARQQQKREEELQRAEVAREEELQRKLREEAERDAEEEKSREAEKERQKEALRMKEAQVERDRLEREQQQLAAEEKQKEQAAELERDQALKREEDLRLQQEREREQEAKRKEDDDAAMIQEARARVLARRKQKQMRDSGESLASSVSASSTTSFRNEHNLHETAPFNSLVSTSASMQAPSASLDIAASVSLPSSSISRSAATASYRYKDADRVDSDEAEQDDDGQKAASASGGYESSFFGSRDRSSRWTASQERANDNRSQARASIPEISKDVRMPV